MLLKSFVNQPFIAICKLKNFQCDKHNGHYVFDLLAMALLGKDFEFSDNKEKFLSQPKLCNMFVFICVTPIPHLEKQTFLLF